MLINGIKFACNTCIKGHRSSSCNHVERPLFEIRKKGRPVTQCAYCRDLRKTKQIHIKCSCTDKSKNQCYQCPSKQQPYPSLGEDHGISYSDIILSSSNQLPMQCTCHETAKTLSGTGHHSSSASTPGAPPISEPTQAKGKEFAWLSPETSRSRNSFDDSYYALQRSSSLRFLDGQAKSPRRRSSLTRKHSKKSSTMMSTYSDSNSSISSSSSYIIENNNMVLNQNCVTIPQPPPPPVPVSAPMMMSEYSENEDAMFMDMSSFDYGVLPQQQNFMTEGDPVSMPVTMNGCYVPCSSSSMTSTPTALSSSFEESSLLYDGPDELTTLLHNVLNDDSSRWTNSSRSSVDMTRTTSSSSAPRVCGSLTPHHCGPPVDPQGQSVVITITPLFEDVKPMTTKIVTCYCGSACQCPGCFVHQHESSSSSYSSDDEELCA